MATLQHVLDIALVRCAAGAAPDRNWGFCMTTVDSDRDDLHGMGYAQELNRKLGWFSNFAISFSIISILAGGMTSYWLGMATGGPTGHHARLDHRRLLRPAGRHGDGRDLLELPDGRRLVLLVGQAGAEERCAVVVVHGLVQPARSDRRHRQRRLRAGHLHRLLHPHVRRWVQARPCSASIGIFLLVLIAHGLLNTFGVQLVKILGDISVWWHVVGVVIIFVHLDDRTDQHQRPRRCVRHSASRAYPAGTAGCSSRCTCSGSGLLLAQYTITGFDASAHVSEETIGARTEAPKAIVRAIYVSAIAAFFLNLAMTSALPKKGAVDASGADIYTGSCSEMLRTRSSSTPRRG